jgi:hypothetical protein
MKNKILIFGDSHSLYFRKTLDLNELMPILKDIDVTLEKLNGATIKGFGNRKSTLNTLDVFLENIRKNSPNVIVFGLGQVDVELGFYYRKIIKRDTTNFEDFCNKLIENYLSSVKAVLSKINFAGLIVFKGINNTTLTINQQKAILYTKRIITENVKEAKEIDKFTMILNEEYPSAFERVNNHKIFNLFLKNKINDEYLYFDINNEINDENGFIKLEYIPSTFDHHLVDSIAVRVLFFSKLLKTLSYQI